MKILNLEEKVVSWQLTKFVIVGVLNTIIDFTFYLSLTRGWYFWQRQYLLANIFSFVLANIFSFIINKSWTFKNSEYDNYHWQYLKFFIVSLVSLLIVELSLFFLVEFLYFYDLLAKVIGILLSLVWSFSVHKFWTFKKSIINKI